MIDQDSTVAAGPKASPPTPTLGRARAVGAIIAAKFAPIIAAAEARHGQLRAYPRLYAGLLALLLVIGAFPDVVFLGTSLRLTDQIEASRQSLPLSVLPQASHRGWWQPYYDTGGAIFQSEPMMEFIRYCVQTRNSPYWTPFSAAGSLGPETLVDQKFSAFTVLYAVFGGGSAVYNALFLLLNWFGVFYVIRTIREHLRLSTLSAVAGGTFFLMNGYSFANLGSNVTQNYLYIPFCLYAAMSFTERRSARSIAAMTFAFTLLLSCTFLPTTVVAMIAIFGIAGGYLIAIEDGSRMRTTLVAAGGYALSVIVAVCILAVLYLPFFESLKQTGILSGYGERVFYPAYMTSLLSLFTPSHFYESYNAMETAATLYFPPPQNPPITGSGIFHCGVIGLCLAACGTRFRGVRLRWLGLACLALLMIAAGRIFAVTVITDVVDVVPVLRNIGGQYWWGAVAVPLALLVALGVENLLDGEDMRVAVSVVIGVAAIAAVFLSVTYGLREPYVSFKKASLLWTGTTAVMTSAAVGLFCMAWSRRRRAWLQAGPLVFLMFAEFTVDSKFVRFPVADVFASPPEWVKYVRERIGTGRTMSFSMAGFMGEQGSAYGVAEITSLNMGSQPAYGEFFRRALQIEQAQRWGDFLSLDKVTDKPERDRVDWPALDLLGVKYAILPPHFSAWAATYRLAGWRLVKDTPRAVVFENPHVLPRAFTIASGSGGIPSDVTLPAGVRNVLAPAEIVQYRNAEVTIRGRADAASMLVLTDNWHQNWRAEVNGVPTRIAKVDGTFRGVAVPAGDFEVKMNYRPKTLTAALAISGAALTGMLGMFFAGDVRRLRARRRPALVGHAATS